MKIPVALINAFALWLIAVWTATPGAWLACATGRRPSPLLAHREEPAPFLKECRGLCSFEREALVGVRVDVMLVVVALVDVVDVARLVAVVLVRVALVRVVPMLFGMVLVTVTLVDVVDVARFVGMVLVGITLMNVVHQRDIVNVLMNHMPLLSPSRTVGANTIVAFRRN